MVASPPSDAKGLDISEEDRTIGVVSTKLYWNYFESGVPASVIIALICFCLITQGKLWQSCSDIKVSSTLVPKVFPDCLLFANGRGGKKEKPPAIPWT